MIKINNELYFLLFACCVPVRGASRSTICDLQRNSFLYIPNELCDILVGGNQVDITLLDEEEKENIVDCLDYLKEEEYGFYSDEPDRFIPIDFTSEICINPIKNAIIDVDKNSTHDFEDISKRLSELFCSAIEIRFFKHADIEEIYQVLQAFESSTIRTINLIIKYNEKWTIENILALRSQNRRLSQVILHHSPFETSEQQPTISILYTKEEITDQTHCGVINPHYFMSNLKFFKESLQVNNCLDRKIGIDTKGNIKNCPSMENSFGHISQINFKNLVSSKAFRKVWSIKKDNIDTCKDCEFRYICMDCRAYKTEENQYSKPTKCKYNPYTTQWET